MIRFFAPGEPIPKQSFRYTNGGGYTPQRVKDWAGYVQTCAWEVKPAELLDVPLVVHLAFYVPTLRRVDSDNLSKCVLDALNGVLWVDDRLVVELTITKEYCGKQGKPGVLVEVDVMRTQEERKALAERVRARVEAATAGEPHGVALAALAYTLLMHCDWRKVDDMEKYILLTVAA